MPVGLGQQGYSHLFLSPPIVDLGLYCPSIKMSASFLEKKSTEVKHSCAKERVTIPVVIDHRKANNPYLSLYGDDWESVMKQKMCTLGFVSNKFSLTTPIAGSSAYRRVMDPETGGSPSPERIVQDCSLWVHALKAIIKSGGALNDFAKRRGRRGEFTESEQESMPTQRGGSRTKGSGNKKERWLHVDAISAIDIKLEETRKTREQEDPDSQAPMEIEESSVALLPV